MWGNLGASKGRSCGIWSEICKVGGGHRTRTVADIVGKKDRVSLVLYVAGSTGAVKMLPQSVQANTESYENDQVSALRYTVTFQGGKRA